MPLSRPRLFQILSLFLGLGLLAITECALRFSGRYTLKSTAPTLPEDWKKSGIEAAGQKTSTLLLRRESQIELSGYAKGYMKTPPFEIQSQTKRAFAFGGSATLGVPVENQPHQTFPGQLQAQLEQLGVQNEVINLGGASFGSDHVRGLAQEVIDLSPDALLIYSGNNEYFNFGLALSEQNRQYTPGSVYLQSLHLFRMLSSLLGRGPTQLDIDPKQLKFEQDKNLAQLILGMMQSQSSAISWHDGRVVRSDIITTTVSDRYKANLQSVIHHHPDTLVLIGEVPPNLFESPWLSLHNPTLSEGRRQDFEVLANRLQTTDCQRALPDWERLIQIDKWRADAWFGLGMCQKELGLEYEVALRNALELDMNPGRPTAALHQALSELDSAQIIRFSSFSTANDFGQPFFHDSCHLTPEGYGAIATEFRNALIAAGWAF